MYPAYKGLHRSLSVRHKNYNRLMDFIDIQENSEKFLVIRPIKKLPVSRIEKNKNKLCSTYNQGYEDASKLYSGILSYLTTLIQ